MGELRPVHAERDLIVYVERGIIILYGPTIEPDGDVPVRLLESSADPFGAEILIAGEGGALFSSDSLMSPAFTIEIWAGEPPPQAEGSWVDHGQGVMVDLAEYMQLIVFIHADEVGPRIPLDRPGDQNIRVHRRGTAESFALVAAGEDHVEGVEQWLVQIWPVEAA